MLFKRIKTPGIAHSAYLFGARGEAALVDPRRDVEEYLELARNEDVTIAYVLETHRQEDFVMGSLEVAQKTGAKVVSLDHRLFGHSDIRLKDGEELTFGGFTIRALHTPGHTPESTCYAVFLEDAPDLAWGLFSGDTLFIGEAGRTDLPDPKTTGENAGLLYDAIHAKLEPLGDQVILWPAHGSGSVCGGNIAERDDSTLGLERVSNPAFTKSREQFIEAKLNERIPHPPYFSLMEKLNFKGGIPSAKKVGEIPLLQPKKLASESKQGLILDGRDPEAFAGGHIPLAYSLWQDGMGVFAGWLANQTAPIYLVLDDNSQLEQVLLALERLGVDGISGALAGGFDRWRDDGQPIAYSGTISPSELAPTLDAHAVLDVRDDLEFEDEGHIPGATHLYVGYLEKHLGRIKTSLAAKPTIVTVCSVGHRASLAASILERHGFTSVKNLLGGMTAWNKLDLPMELGAEGSVSTTDIEGPRT